MPSTKIYIILDRSGSMQSCKNDTIGGFNSFIEKQKKIKEDIAYISLYQFDDEYETVYENKLINEVPLLDSKTFEPRGCTALLDAIGMTISNVKYENDDTIIIVILTDGEENASENYKKTTINNMIKEKQEIGWEFIFIGANQDAIKEAENLGISSQSAITYDTRGRGTQNAFECLGNAIKRTRTTPSAMRKENRIEFTQEERIKSISIE